MPTPTYDLIASTTLATASPSVVFGSLPQGYRDLIFVLRSVTETAVDNRLRFNGDTGSNYHHVVMSARTAPESATFAATSFAVTYYSSSSSAGNSNTIIQIMDYSATDKHKTLLVRSNRSNDGVDAYAARWGNTAAVTSIEFNNSGVNFSAGTTINLYGIAG